MSREVADSTRSKKPWTARPSPMACFWARLGTRTRHSAPIKPVGRLSRGIVIPQSTPKAEMAAEGSAPPATSLAGMSTALAEPRMVPSREVAATGIEMDSSCPQPTCSRGGDLGAERHQRRKRAVRVTAEKISHRTMPVTMMPTVSSRLRGSRRISSPSTAPVRMSCSTVSVRAGGRIWPIP